MFSYDDYCTPSFQKQYIFLGIISFLHFLKVIFSNLNCPHLLLYGNLCGVECHLECVEYKTNCLSLTIFLMHQSCDFWSQRLWHWCWKCEKGRMPAKCPERKWEFCWSLIYVLFYLFLVFLFVKKETLMMMIAMNLTVKMWGGKMSRREMRIVPVAHKSRLCRHTTLRDNSDKR